MNKKVVASSVLVMMLASMTSVQAAYEEIDCSSDAVFAENSCSQCFDGGSRAAGDNIGMIDDIWVNNTDLDQLMYEESQTMPEMINLNTDKVQWSQTPSADGFWEYTDEVRALYDTEVLLGNVLPAGESVTWIKSKLGSAYTIDSNEAASGENIGLLVFPLEVHPILESGEVSVDTEVHKECVLFKSGEAGETPLPPKELPKTGPAQFFILLVLAMILAFGVMRFKKS